MGAGREGGAVRHNSNEIIHRLPLTSKRPSQEPSITKPFPFIVSSRTPVISIVALKLMSVLKLISTPLAMADCSSASEDTVTTEGDAARLSSHDRIERRR